MQRTYGESPIKVMRRTDVAGVRVQLDKGGPSLDFRIAHVDLYFFDIDIAILAVEIHTDDIEFGVSGCAVPVRSRLSGVLGQGRARGPLPESGRMAGCSGGTCCRSRITSGARSFCRSYASTVRRAWRRIGNS